MSLENLTSKPFKNLLAFFSLFVLAIQPDFAHAAAKSEAYVGQPFGVGRVTIDVLRGEPVLPLSDERFTVLEANGRVVYPALKQEPVRKILRNLLDMESPRKVTINYLFSGNEPFDLSPFTPYEQGVRVKPLANSAGHKRLLAEWWEQYTNRYQSLLSNGAYPPVAENFLMATLSRRLGLTMPEPKRGILDSTSNKENPLSYLMVDEAHRLRVDRDLLSVQSDEQLEPAPLPEPIQWPDPEIADEALADVAVEGMAAHVPEECFYLRFGNFTNYLWFRDLNKKWQGDLGNMILRRGIVRGSSDRIQQQLSLRENALAKILGPQVIADAAIIGLDTYVDQGAAIGILFQAKNEFLLAADMTNQRREALTKFDDAEEQTLEIEGQSVSLISTPGGEVRSYYVADDGFHLITTSQTLVERFLQAGQGKRSLAKLTSFRRMRQQFPIDRDDTMVAFVSELFWQNLSSPKYIIENSRRMRSVRETALLELASYSAECEGKPSGSTDELTAAGILPDGFGARVDGSQLQLQDDKLVDSRRGAMGTFVPVADMEVAEISAGEVAIFGRFKKMLKDGIGQMPPIGAAIHRIAGEQNEVETITIDIHAQGSLREQLGKVATWIGQPAETRLKPVEGDLLAVEAVVEFPSSLGDSDGSEQHLFGGLRDFRSPLTVKRGAVRPDAAPAELVRGYLGAWPKPGLLQWFTGGEKPDGPQPQPVGEDMWQAKQDDFLLLSFKSDVIERVLPQLELVPAERPAQAWVQLQDLTGTEMAENANALGYMRTRDTSAAGSRMMNSLANQLRVPRHQCREVAERLIDGTFVCPLGGEYQLYEPKRGLEVWASSALPESNRFLLTEVPEDFRLPLLEWFRGLKGDVCLDEQALRAHLEVKMTPAALP